MKRYKRRREARLIRQSQKTVKGLKWDKAVTVLTGALTKAIWREGGERDDAIATADIVHHAICRDLASWFDLNDRKRPINVVPFRRKKSYFR